MKTSNLILGSVLAVALVGCVTPEATKPVATGVNLREYQQVKLVVTNTVTTPYAILATPLFDGLLKGSLQSLGYSLVETNAQLVLEVKVNQLEPGSRSARFWVGFGAGKAVMKYTAQFKDSSGNLLAELQGGKAYSGMELSDNAAFKSDDSIRMGMVSASVSQLTDFIQHNGRP